MGLSMKVKKTYKLFINGQFPRTESGRYFQVTSNDGVYNISRASRKDTRDAIVAARAAVSGWKGKTAYNRGQILYRIAEMLDGDNRFGDIEKSLSVDRLVYYAGWADKISSVFGTVNPVSGPYINFTTPEPSGVVGVLLSRGSGLVELVSLMTPAIVSGNTVVIITTNQDAATKAIDFAETLNLSDIPAGVINILTCDDESLYDHVANHMDVNAIVTNDQIALPQLKKQAATNLKRIFLHHSDYWHDRVISQSPYWILDTMEAKTIWHPISV